MRSKRIYIIIFLLTAIDIVFTWSGLQNGFISEANPLMKILIEKFQLLAYAGVLIGVAAALYFLYKVSERIRWLPAALALILVAKVSVILLHLGWILGINNS